jgi:hypothetical protein
MESLKEIGIALCETCDGYVPTTQVGEDVYCAFEMMMQRKFCRKTFRTSASFKSYQQLVAIV